MAFDALTIKALSAELDNLLGGGKIGRTRAVDSSTFVVPVFKNGIEHNLLISCHPTYARAYITSKQHETAQLMPPFCAHLKKHLTGGVITKISCVNAERVIMIDVICQDEMRIKHSRRLVLEIMGRYSNIILVNSDNTVSDCVYKAAIGSGGKRVLFPSLAYTLPPAQNKPDINSIPELSRALGGFKGGKIEEYAVSVAAGFSQTAIKEACTRVFGTQFFEKEPSEISANSSELAHELKRLYNENPKPNTTTKNGFITDFYFCDYLSATGEKAFCQTISEAADEYYFSLIERREFETEKNHIAASLSAEIKKSQKRVDWLCARIKECENRERDRLFGELITANIHKISRGDERLVAENYYDGSTVEISLDKNLAPAKNAALYFKRYSKKTKGQEYAQAQLAELEAHLSNKIAERNKISAAKNLDELCLTQAESQSKQNQKQNKKSRPRIFTIDGLTVLVGRNNKQNDELVKSSRPNDVWLHAAKNQGSHGVICANNKTVQFETIIKAAELVAFYSKGKHSGKIDVDYTLVKFVSKPKKAKEGKVIYTRQKTVLVEPKALSKEE